MSKFFSLFFAGTLLLNLQAHSQDSLAAFIASHTQKSSVFLKKGDSILVALNPDRMMPLASTMKVLVALEFSKQAAHKVFDMDARVALSDLAKYYLPNTDGNAHPQWIQQEKKSGKIIRDSVSLLEVARGMIQFSSNANTEYLMDLLGLENINNNYRLMGVKDFTPLSYLVSSLMLYQNPHKMKEDKILKQIRLLTADEYQKATSMIHAQLKFNPNYIQQFRPQDLTLTMQKVWSDRLPASTTRSYAHIGEILNNRKIFEKSTYDILTQVLETAMENPANQQYFQVLGMKGGSTAFVLTKMLYATLKSGEKIELAYFFNDLDYAEVQQLTPLMNTFEIRMIFDPATQKFVGNIQ